MILTVDLHTHILPGVDDGADSLAEAMEMLGIAYMNGTRHILLTPHYLTLDMRSKGISKEELANRFNTFKETAARKYPELKLYQGAEMFGVSNIEEAIEKDLIITINNTPNVLIEFGFEDQLSRTLGVTEVLLSKGYIPIIAHPERYSFILENPRNIVNFLEKGALLQINTTSFSRRAGHAICDVALSFLENGFATVIASDAHSTYQRIPDLSEAYSFVSSNFSGKYAEALFYNNPLAILNGKRL